MGFDEAMKIAARVADKAVARAMRKYRDELVTDEDDLTGVLVGQLDAAFEASRAGDEHGVRWSSSILRHRKGVAGEEKRIGADMIIHVSLSSPIQSYSKAVLIQAKRHEPGAIMSSSQHRDLVSQCQKMLDITPASFVFDYARNTMRCGSATKVSGSKNADLYSTCDWTSYRFFLELFRCPIGDPRITSAKASDLPVPIALFLKGEGNISSP